MDQAGGERMGRDGTNAVFLSYASEDTAAAGHICEALREAGVEVWFDRSELRGGDAWDQTIRQRIRDCRLFVPIISSHTDARSEGYFRREWKLAVDRTEDMAGDVTFVVPVVVDGTSSATARVPPKFREVQWTRLPAGAATAPFVERLRALLGASLSPERHIPSDKASGVRRPNVDGGAVVAVRASRWPRVVPVSAAAGLLVLVGGYFAVDRLVLSKRAAPVPNAATDKSIAVLPFVDMSEKHDQEYFSDGMAEEIIDLLVKVPELKVPARTSSFYFKGKSTQIPDIARQLGVANVLEGSVRKSGSHMRVTAQLVRADNGFHIWSETYDRQLDDVFQTQDEIAGAVVKALKISLVRPAAPVAIPTPSNEAYELYLRARELANRGSEDGILKGYEDLRQAVSLDPKFALAWANLAELLAIDNVNWGLVIGQSGSHTSRDSTDLENWESTWAQARADARAAADEAIRLAPELAESHAARAQVLELLDWNWSAADSEMRRALEIEPNSARFNELYSCGCSAGPRRHNRKLAASPAGRSARPAWTRLERRWLRAGIQRRVARGGAGLPQGNRLVPSRGDGTFSRCAGAARIGRTPGCLGGARAGNFSAGPEHRHGAGTRCSGAS
jgi:TolB-like protein